MNDLNILQILKKFEGKLFSISNSSASKNLGYTLVRAEKGVIEIELVISDVLTNPAKQLHGGITSLIFDEVCGLAFYSIGEEHFYTTVNLNVDYLYSANVGEKIRAIATVQRYGKRIANVSAELFNESNVCLARASCNLANTNKKLIDIASFLDKL